MNVTGIATPETFDNTYLYLIHRSNEQVEIRRSFWYCRRIYFQEGSNVSSCQILFKVNDIELRAQLRQTNVKV
jgi:membrane fusion protein (multidrug efflux system)